MSKRNVEAVLSTTLSKGHDRRWVVVNKDTGEIVDDAQGYGFKSPQKAYAAHAYKTRPKSQVRNERRVKRLVREWVKENRSVAEEIEYAMFRTWKEEMRDLSPKEIEEILSGLGVEDLPFTVKQLLKFW